MKKLVLIVLAILTINVASAQFKAGVKAGMTANVASLDFDNMSEVYNAFQDKKGVGFHIGLQFRVDTGIGLYVAADALYNYSPESVGMIQNDQITSLAVRRHSIEIPVVVGFRILFIRAYVGPKFYVNLGNTQKQSGPGDMNISADFENEALGYQLGLGFDIMKKVSIDVTYNGSFSTSNRNFSFTDAVGSAIGDMNSKMSNKQLWISVGVYF